MTRNWSSASVHRSALTAGSRAANCERTQAADAAAAVHRQCAQSSLTLHSSLQSLTANWFEPRLTSIHRPSTSTAQFRSSQASQTWQTCKQWISASTSYCLHDVTALVHKKVEKVQNVWKRNKLYLNMNSMIWQEEELAESTMPPVNCRYGVNQGQAGILHPRMQVAGVTHRQFNSNIMQLNPQSCSESVSHLLPS